MDLSVCFGAATIFLVTLQSFLNDTEFSEFIEFSNNFFVKEDLNLQALV